MDFYEEQKDQMARQLELNRAEFEGIDPEARALVEGYRPGTYVRIEHPACSKRSARPTSARSLHHLQASISHPRPRTRLLFPLHPVTASRRKAVDG